MDFEPNDNAFLDGWKLFILCGDGTIFPNDTVKSVCTNYLQNGSNLYDVLYSYTSLPIVSLERPAYRREDAYRLILPFLRAADLSNTALKNYFKNTLNIASGASRTLRFVQEFSIPFLVSSSYEHYICEVCEALDFPLENTYSMSLDLDYWDVSATEKKRLQELAAEISSMTPITAPTGDDVNLDDLTEQDCKNVLRLDDIFENELVGFQTFRMLSSSTPMGREEKAASLLDIRRKTGFDLEDMMVICSSASDTLIAHMVREGGGLVVAFNATPSAICTSNLAVVSEDTTILSFLADVFQNAGKEHVEELAANWTEEAILAAPANKYLINELLKINNNKAPLVAKINTDVSDVLYNEEFVPKFF